MTEAEQVDYEEQLLEEILEFRHDPLGYVLYAFPWGEAGTSLADEPGPREWQREVLNEIGAKLRAGEPVEKVVGQALATVSEPILEAIASGHGIGKSALVSWIIMWAMSTCHQTRGVVTANTEKQLRTKTWPEVKKWHAMAINSHWFTCAATSLHAHGDDEKTWRIDAIPWSDNNTEAFAGLHNKGFRILVIFDEASSISDKIWEVTDGALTDENTEIIWCAFGNPTRNTGRFRQCFGRLGHRWNHRQIDSRTVPGTNKTQIQKWIDDYGEDSDFVRIRVRGQFPRSGSMQLIPGDVVTAASRVDPVSNYYDPVIIGADVARFGDDESVLCLRRGRDGRSVWEYHRGIDTMQFAARIAALAQKHHAHAIFVDETGVGGGVVDRLRQLGLKPIGVNNGGKADAPEIGTDAGGEAAANKAAEMWLRMRAWLKTGGAIPDDAELAGQLEGREFGYNQHNEILLERKDDMKARGLSSPDRADALAITFAYPVASIATTQAQRPQTGTLARPGTYNPFQRR